MKGGFCLTVSLPSSIAILPAAKLLCWQDIQKSVQVFRTMRIMLSHLKVARVIRALAEQDLGKLS